MAFGGSLITRKPTWKTGLQARSRLVALQHRSLMFNQSRYIQGTWMYYVLGLIWDKFPGLRDAMRICYPRGY